MPETTKLQKWVDANYPKPRSLKEAVELRLEIMGLPEKEIQYFVGPTDYATFEECSWSEKFDPLCDYCHGCKECPLIVESCCNGREQVVEILKQWLAEELKEVTTD